MRTQQEVQTAEETAIHEFRSEFEALCNKHGINAIVFGARKQTEKFSTEETEDETASMCTAFCSACINEPKIEELKAIDSAFDSVQENIISKMHRDIDARIMKARGVDIADLAKDIGAALEEAFGGECDCENCKKEKEAEAASEVKSEA